MTPTIPSAPGSWSAPKPLPRELRSMDDLRAVVAKVLTPVDRAEIRGNGPHVCVLLYRPVGENHTHTAATTLRRKAKALAAHIRGARIIGEPTFMAGELRLGVAVKIG